MNKSNLIRLAAIAMVVAAPTLADAGTHSGADIAHDHLLYFAGPEDMAADSARPAGPEDFEDLHNDHLLYFVQETPEGEASSTSSRGWVDYTHPGEWPLTPDNFL